jgi:hypothetical protein
MRSIEELIPEDFEKIDENLKKFKVELFNYVIRQFKIMRWGEKRAAAALRIPKADYRRMYKGEIDQWGWIDGFRFLCMIRCEMHLVVRPLCIIGAPRMSKMIPVQEFQPNKMKKEERSKRIDG